MKKKFNYIKDFLIQFFKNTPKRKLFVYSIAILLCIPLLYSFVTFSRYVISNNYENYLVSREFYFYSYTLGDQTDPIFRPATTSHVLTDWDGESSYTLVVDVRNYVDELRWTKEAISYTTSVTCPNTVICSSNDGTINYDPNAGTSNRINIVLTNPNENYFHENDYIDMEVSVTSTSPYRRTLSGTFRIYVKLQTIKYSIEDQPNQKYFDLYLSNYDSITQNVQLGWNQDDVSVDNTNSYIISAMNSGNLRTTTINNKTYVNGVTISIDQKKSIAIRFYKVDKTINYTYPIINNTSVITVE